MNIFVTSYDPIECAQNLDDKRVIKMVLESAQMLCAAMHHHNIPNVPYKLVHKNHPCTLWVKRDKNNFKWLLAHFEALLAEYNLRSNGKIHKCDELTMRFYEALWDIPTGKDLTPFVNCASNKQKGYDYTNIKDVTKAYKIYLNERFKYDKIRPKWTNRNQPNWVDGEYQIDIFH